MACDGKHLYTNRVAAVPCHATTHSTAATTPTRTSLFKNQPRRSFQRRTSGGRNPPRQATKPWTQNTHTHIKHTYTQTHSSSASSSSLQETPKQPQHMRKRADDHKDRGESRAPRPAGGRRRVPKPFLPAPHPASQVKRSPAPFPRVSLHEVPPAPLGRKVTPSARVPGPVTQVGRTAVQRAARSERLSLVVARPGRW